jgi:heat shock protein HslJ
MKYVWFFSIIACLVACSSQQPTSQAQDGMAASGEPLGDPTAETVWRLVQMGPVGALQEVQAEFTLIFDEATQRLAGKAGCNQYFAGYTLQSDALVVSAPGATKKFCHTPENIMALESSFLQYLAEAEHLADEGTELVLTCKGGNLLVFIRQ